MSVDQRKAIIFEISADDVATINKLASGRQTRLSGYVKDGKLVIDAVGFAQSEFDRGVFVAVNAPFKTAQAMAHA